MIKHLIGKNTGFNAWNNNGFFVLDPSATDRIAGADTSRESAPLERISCDGERSIKGTVMRLGHFRNTPVYRVT
jgi:hypothetical protein